MAEYIKREALVDLVLGKLKFMGDARIMNKGDEKVLSEIDGYEKAIYAVHELLLDKDLIEDIQPVKRGKMIAMSDEEKYRAYKDTARDYDGRCSLCNCCVYDTDIFCAECGAILQDVDATKG